MPKFSLFRKPKKQPEPEKPAVPLKEESTEEAVAPPQEQKQETVAPPVEQKHQAAETLNKTYLKAVPLKELTDLENIKNEVKNGNIIILRVTPLANKSIDEVKSAVNELYEFTESIGGDIARLGEERVVICPKNMRIWREKTPVSNEPLPTAA